MRRLMKNKTLLLWSILPLLVLLEIIQQLRIPGQEPSAADWQAAVRAVAAEKQPRDLVVIAPDWAVQGRMYFKDLITWKDFGRFDTTLYRRIFEVSMAGESAPETTGLTPLNTRRLGKLTVSLFELPSPDTVVYDFSDHLKEATAAKNVDKRPKIIIDHWFFPRRVVGIRLNTHTTLTYRDVPLKGILRGYGIIDYREGRYNKGAPATVNIYVNDKRIAHEEIANFGPLCPFEAELPVASGKGTVRFEISASGNPKRELGLAADIRIKGVP